MKDRIILGRQALRGALAVRSQHRIGRDSALCIYDLAEAMGIEVRFRPEKSLEGMYIKDGGGIILLSAFRPPGRQAFTCAHELGHHYFGHGTRVDHYTDRAELENAEEPDEVLANLFAAHILMPAPAIQRCFESRGWNIQTSDPLQLFRVSGQLGVGYGTLINHICWNLQLISPARAESLLKVSPKSIRMQALGENRIGDLLIVDRQWTGRAIDIRIGDIALLPSTIRIEHKGAVELAQTANHQVVIQGAKPGLARAETEDGLWSAFIRVSRVNYVGRSIFRHLEDPDED